MPTSSDNKPSILLMARGRAAGQSLRRVLKQGGYVVLPARDCREAVALFPANPIDLRAPILHGLATFKLLHACNSRVPFVVTVTPPVDLTPFDRNSCRTILERPFHTATLLGGLRDIPRQPAPRQT